MVASQRPIAISHCYECRDKPTQKVQCKHTSHRSTLTSARITAPTSTQERRSVHQPTNDVTGRALAMPLQITKAAGETCDAEAQRERRSHYYFTILIGKQCDVQVLARRQSGTLPLAQIRPMLQHSMCILRPMSAVISSQ